MSVPTARRGRSTFAGLSALEVDAPSRSERTIVFNNDSIRFLHTHFVDGVHHTQTKVDHWLHSFDDLIIEEVFLGEDKQLLE